MDASAGAPLLMAAPAAVNAARSNRRAHLSLSASSLPPVYCLLLLLSLLLIAPASLFPTSPALRELAERAAPSPAQLGVFLTSSVVTRWGVLFAASESCPFSSPGTTGCSSTNAPYPGLCDPITSCYSPQKVGWCIMYCGSKGVAPYGGSGCPWNAGQRCQVCSGNSPIANPMTCSRTNTHTTHSSTEHTHWQLR